MIFTPDNMEKILRGEKTETRRVARVTAAGDVIQTMYLAGRTYPLQPGRGKRRVGRVEVEGVRLERAGEIPPDSVQREGFATRRAFIEYVARLWNTTPEAAAERQVWAIRFRVVEILDNPWVPVEAKANVREVADAGATIEGEGA